MRRWPLLFAVAGACLPGLLGCGGASSHTSSTQLEGGGAASAQPEGSGGGRAAAGNGGALTIAGNGGSPTNAGGGGAGGNLVGPGQAGSAAGWKPTCGSATSLIAPDSGFEHCSAGYIRRVGPAHCPSTLPRPTALPNYNPAFDTCKLDTDCLSSMYGPYAHCGTRFGGNAHVCLRGCAVDTDCETGEACLCGDAVGRCVPSTCRSGADCGPDKDCASFETGPTCFATQFGCQKSADSCSSDSDCQGFAMNPTFCVFVSPGSRGCTTAQCYGP